MPSGLSSTLIHFAPLLTTTSPCGQYFFFDLFYLADHPRSGESCRVTQKRVNHGKNANETSAELLAFSGFSFYLLAARSLDMVRETLAIVCTLVAAAVCAQAQQDNGDVRVSVVLNADGSRTVYENDAANHKSVATTTAKDGKLRDKIRWDLDENGRFLRGEVFGPKEQFRFTLQNKYDASNRLIEETHFAKDQSVIGKIVFRYDAAGHQIGYSTYDGNGKLLSQTAVPSASPKRK